MPNRIIKESIWTSPSINKLSALAERHFYRLLPLPDDFGCFEATPPVVKGKCYPFHNKVTIKNVDEWHKELQKAEIINFWEDNGRMYGVFLNWDKHQRIRSLHNRRTPEPPKEIFDSSCRQMSSNDRLNLNLNPNPNPNLNKESITFEDIWNRYPKKVGRKNAERHFESSVKTEEDFKKINLALDHYLKSERVAKGYVQNGSTWFCNWQDWVSYQEPVCPKCKGKKKYVSPTGYGINCDCKK